MTGNTIEITNKQIDFKEIVDLIHSYRVEIRSAHFEEPTIEDVFLRITGKELRE